MEDINLDEIFNQCDTAEPKQSMPEKELRKAYMQAEKLEFNQSIEGMEFLGGLFEPYHDITLWQDKNGKFWYSSYYIGD